MSSFVAANVIWIDSTQSGTDNIWVKTHTKIIHDDCAAKKLNDNVPDQTKQKKNAITKPDNSQYAHPRDRKPLEGFQDPTTDAPMTPSTPALCPRPSDQGACAAPMWVPANNTEALNMMQLRWAAGYNDDGSWGSWPQRDANPYLAGIYNAAGHMIRKTWMASDDAQSLVAFAARDAKVNCMVIDSPPWDPSVPNVATRPDQRAAIRRADCLAFVTHHVNHYTGLFVNQVTGYSFWYDSYWRDGESTMRYALDMDHLCKFYQSLGAHADLIRIIRAKAGIVIGPQQPDGWTCGLHVAEFIRCCIRDNVTNIEDSPTWSGVWNSARGEVIEHVIVKWRQWITLEFSPPGNYGKRDLRKRPALLIDNYEKQLRTQGPPKPDQGKGNDGGLVNLFGALRTPSGTVSHPPPEAGKIKTPSPKALPKSPTPLPKPSPKPPKPADKPDQGDVPMDDPNKADDKDNNKDDDNNDDHFPACPVDLTELSSTAVAVYQKTEGQRRANELSLRNTRQQRKQVQGRKVKSITEYTRDEYISMFDNPYEVVADRQKAWTVYLQPTIAPGWQGHKRHQQGLIWDKKKEEEREEAKREKERDDDKGGGRYNMRRR